LIVRHVIIGAVFTLAGVVSLLLPEVPFICIGALIFGPIELLIGLFGEGRRRRRAPATPFVGWTGVAAAGAPVGAPGGAPGGPPAKFCHSCGTQNEGLMMYCRNCGAQLSYPAGTGEKG